ncbi:MAG: hypothetical protein AAFQ57_04270 [Cyanobacteria bacterium J06626_14]
MTLSLQVVVIAVLIALLLGILIGYASVQGRLKRQRKALEESQNRLADLETSHESRLRDTAQSLRRDYEAELSKIIEHYQDQLSDKTLELKQTYETRLKVLEEGLITPTSASSPVHESNTLSNADAVESFSKPETHLKQQYEMRLKEAAHKLQQAYEKQLAQHAKSVTADLQAEYEQRLTEKIEHYDRQFAVRQAQLEQEYASRYGALSQSQGGSLTPSEIISTRNDTTVTLQSQNQPSTTLTQADLEGRIREATQQIRQDYERQLSTKLEEYQTQLNSRVQELEKDYRTRLGAIANMTPDPTPTIQPSNIDDLEPLDLSDISPSN